MIGAAMRPRHQLRCPSCARTNDVPKGVTVADVRCASCASGLDVDKEVCYFVATGPDVVGPLAFSAVRAWIKAGNLEADMLFSEEGGPWTKGEELPELFPRGGALPRMSPVRVERERPTTPTAARDGRRRVPGTVRAMSILDYLMTGIFLLAFGVATSFGESGGAFLSLALAIGHGALGAGLVRGAQIARFLQLALVGLAALGLLRLLFAGMPVGLAFLGLIFVLIPVLLLVNRGANAFFAGGAPESGATANEGDRTRRRE